MSVRQAYERKAHPTFYRAWTPEEIAKLKELVLAHGDDWETIRANMPYDRPMNVLKTKWREKVNPDIHHGRFTPDELKRLEQAVSTFGNDWKRIAAHVEHRTPKQCNSAWKTLTQIERNASTRYSRFTPEEDQAIIDAVQKHGAQNFQTICDAIKSPRWPSVLRDRYFDYLDPTIDRSPWTDEEEKQAYELYQQFGRRAGRVKKYLGSRRSRRDIETHCRLYEKKKRKESVKPAGSTPSPAPPCCKPTTTTTTDLPGIDIKE
ncbi:hypothetical protein BX666DRAFT_1877225 [Dichotomocladium elegans]|nr:hypothetical protein BX666DRAFT_1877225 [Dichotomocladium elegans]